MRGGEDSKWNFFLRSELRTGGEKGKEATRSPPTTENQKIVEDRGKGDL